MTIKDDVMIKNSELTKDPKYFHSYAFCSDTRFFKDIISKVRNVDVNIAESLGKNPILVTALNREIGYEKAAQIAKSAKVKILITGHYSQR